MSYYYAIIEQFSDNNELYIFGLSNNQNDEIKLYNVSSYENDRVALFDDAISYMTKDRTEDAYLWLSEYKQEYQLINPDIRKVRDVIIKADDSSYKVKKNESDFVTLFLKNSRNYVDKSIDEHEATTTTKNRIVLNRQYYTLENDNKLISVNEYSGTLSEEVKTELNTYVDQERTTLTSQINTYTPPVGDINTLPVNNTGSVSISTELKADTTNDRLISIEKMNLATSGNDVPSFNPTNILIEHTILDNKIFKEGMVGVTI
jgi:hypothetical protein